MYQYIEKKEEISVLSSLIFNDKSEYYTSHEKWGEFNHLLNQINEVRGMFIVRNGENRFVPELLFIDESLERKEGNIINERRSIEKYLGVITHRYWNSNHYAQLYQAQTLSEMKDIALNILSGMSGPIYQICGPITSGGSGSIEKNLEVFNKAIQKLSENRFVFDQMPFGPFMRKMSDEGAVNEGNILEDFYRPLFESRFYSGLCFLPTWKSSIGAKWEHERAKELGIRIKYLDDSYRFEEELKATI
ncbi:hypothetical protein COB64_02145 [Candidatus Wolfebacteria bacterium]|nr:MAG: hypothetical protein COB64_02145 [Candidatus Wolfebacteria bacterium]